MNKFDYIAEIIVHYEKIDNVDEFEIISTNSFSIKGGFGIDDYYEECIKCVGTEIFIEDIKTYLEKRQPLSLGEFIMSGGDKPLSNYFRLVYGVKHDCYETFGYYGTEYDYDEEYELLNVYQFLSEEEQYIDPDYIDLINLQYE